LNLEQLKEAVARCFPEIPIKTVKLIPTGWDNYVLEVNDNWIFRFPRRKDAVLRLQMELELLPFVAEIVSIRIPEFEKVWRGGRDFKQMFVGYRRIPGEHMTSDLVDFSKDSHVVLELSDFLNEMHRISTARLRSLDVPYFTPAKWRLDLQRLINQITTSVQPLLKEQARRRLRSVSEDFQKYADSFGFSPTFIHCDLDGANILCDSSTRRITGIIDWGDACIGDPAFDFSGLLYEYGTRFLDALLSHYSHEDKSELKRRIIFYSSLIPFRLILGARMTQRQFRVERDEVIIFEGQKSIHFSLLKHAAAIRITHNETLEA
jgi:aminoglycoside 2''-phosphotransferase